MQSIRAGIEAVVPAAPKAVYDVLADYVDHHPQILPKPYFTSLAVERGGKGAGTVIRVQMNVLGAKRTLRMHVTEPLPGTVLQETDADSGTVTSFKVTPLEDGKRSLVRIETEWRSKPGIAGKIEGFLNPLIARSIYKKELALLAAYVRALGAS